MTLNFKENIKSKKKKKKNNQIYKEKIKHNRKKQMYFKLNYIKINDRHKINNNHKNDF